MTVTRRKEWKPTACPKCGRYMGKKPRSQCATCEKNQDAVRQSQERLTDLKAQRAEREGRYQEEAAERDKRREAAEVALAESERLLKEAAERRIETRQQLEEARARRAGAGVGSTRKDAKLVFACLGVLVIFFTGAWLYSRSSAAPQVPPTHAKVPVAPAETTDNSHDAGPSDVELLTYSQTETKKALEAKLKDPDTAKYRDVAAYHVAGKYAFCGEVNAKNGFGGYAGYERFVGVPNQAFLESEVTGFDEVWANFCNPARKGQPIWW